MKKHAIIPLFIPHLGCNNDCVFCNQKRISGRTSPIEIKDIKDIIERNLSTIEGREIEDIQIAFYGGSFTGLDFDLQTKYLKIANEYIESNRINSIRLSTRPDYIDEKILLNLKKYGVKTIELGAQSFDEEVLQSSKRGHNRQDIINSSKLIKSMGFNLGIQLMIGLPKDTETKDLYSTEMAISLGADITRIYPCLIIKDTELEDMYLSKKFKPFSLEDTISIGSKMYRMFHRYNVDLIRVGLKASSLVEESLVYRGNYHPSYRQLVEGRIFREDIEEVLKYQKKDVIMEANSQNFSSLIGFKGENKKYFEQKYRNLKIKYRINNKLENLTFTMIN